VRGRDDRQSTMFRCISAEDRVPADHPLRSLHALVEPVLNELSPRFDEMYSKSGRPSIPPGAAAARLSAAGALFDPQRAPADGAPGLQHSVRWLWV
jgi:hypothetical protein